MLAVESWSPPTRVPGRPWPGTPKNSHPCSKKRRPHPAGGMRIRARDDRPGGPRVAPRRGSGLLPPLDLWLKHRCTPAPAKSACGVVAPQLSPWGPPVRSLRIPARTPDSLRAQKPAPPRDSQNHDAATPQDSQNHTRTPATQDGRRTGSLRIHAWSFAACQDIPGMARPGRRGVPVLRAGAAARKGKVIPESGVARNPHGGKFGCTHRSVCRTQGTPTPLGPPDPKLASSRWSPRRPAAGPRSSPPQRTQDAPAGNPEPLAAKPRCPLPHAPGKPGPATPTPWWSASCPPLDPFCS